MHKLLSGQLKFVFGQETVPESWRTFTDIVDQSYTRYDEIIQAERLASNQQIQAGNEALEREHIRLESSIKSLNIGFILTDSQKKILTVNSAAKFILFRREINSGRLIHDQQSNLLNFNCQLEDVARKLSGKVDLFKLLDETSKIKRPLKAKEIELNGVYLKMMIIPIVVYDGELKVINTVILLEDITESKKIEHARDEFFSIASHELRTPLSAVSGNAALIRMYFQDRVMDKGLRQMVDDIILASKRLNEIVNDFLDLSRLEEGRIKFAKDTVDLLDVVNQTCRELERIALDKRLYLKIENPHYLTPRVLADEGRLKQVLVNLIGNAIKFTSWGGVTVALDEESGSAIVRVKDMGNGIKKEDQGHIFHKFKQFDSDIYKTDVNTGTGLGLYICKLLMDGMGGEIDLESSIAGKGTTFRLKLPLVEDLPSLT